MKPPLLATFLVFACALLAPVAGARQGPESAPLDASLYDDAVLRDLYLTFENADWPAELAANRDNDRDFPVRVTLDGVSYDQAGIRYKGNTSYNVQSAKKPFNLTMDSFVPGQDLLGYDVVNLNNGAGDPSMVREILAFRLMRDYMPAPKAAFVRVHVNGSFFGLYVMVQQIDRRFLGEWFRSKDGVLFKGDPPRAARIDAAPLTWLGESTGAYQAGYELKTADAGDPGWVALREMVRVLDAPVSAGGVEDAQLEAAITEVLDVDRALWYLAAHNISLNLDSYYAGHNYYIVRAEDDGRFHMLSWDMNFGFASFGGFGGRGGPGGQPGAGNLVELDPLHQLNQANRPLIRRLLAVPRYRADYLAHFRTLRDEAFAPQRVEQLATAYQSLIRESMRGEPSSIYGFDAFERNLREDVQVAADRPPRGGGPTPAPGATPAPGGQLPTRSIPGVLRIVNERSAWLATHAELQRPDLRLSERTQRPERPAGGENVAVAVRFEGTDAPVAAELQVRVDGAAPRLIPMVPADEGLWTGTLPAEAPGTEVDYAVRVELADGRAVFHPAANQTQPWAYTVSTVTLPPAATGELVINELAGDNRTGATDPAGEHEDWIELVNRGRSPLSLAGFYLSDSEGDPWRFALPEQTLAPGEHVVVWCDDDLDQGPLHAGFRLSKDGETVTLATREAIVDTVTFGPQAPDQSFGRIRDGDDEWAVCRRTTPGRANACGRLEPWLLFLPLSSR